MKGALHLRARAGLPRTERPRCADEGGRPVVSTPATPAAVAAPGAKASLRGHRSFTAYLTGESTSMIGTAVHTVAMPVLAVVHLKADPGQISLLGAADTVGDAWPGRSPRRGSSAGSGPARSWSPASRCIR